MAMGPTREKIKDQRYQSNKKVISCYMTIKLLASAALVKGVDPLYTAIIEGSWSGDGPLCINPSCRSQ